MLSINAVRSPLIFKINTMPYSVDGWIEILWDWSLEEETQLWCGFMSLSRFNFYGDDIPDRLFGLTKHPCDNPYNGVVLQSSKLHQSLLLDVFK